VILVTLILLSTTIFPELPDGTALADEDSTALGEAGHVRLSVFVLNVTWLSPEPAPD
jgi:hypothetical protein